MDFEGLDDLKDAIMTQLIVGGPATSERLSRLVGMPISKVMVVLLALVDDEYIQELPGGEWMAVREYQKSPKL